MTQNKAKRIANIVGIGAIAAGVAVGSVEGWTKSAEPGEKALISHNGPRGAASAEVMLQTDSSAGKIFVYGAAGGLGGIGIWGAARGLVALANMRRKDPEEEGGQPVKS